MRTNLGKTKEEIILELLISINQRNGDYHVSRVEEAISQYQQLVDEFIIVEL